MPMFHERNYVGSDRSWSTVVPHNFRGVSAEFLRRPTPLFRCPSSSQALKKYMVFWGPFPNHRFFVFLSFRSIFPIFPCLLFFFLFLCFFPFFLFLHFPFFWVGAFPTKQSPAQDLLVLPSSPPTTKVTQAVNRQQGCQGMQRPQEGFDFVCAQKSDISWRSMTGVVQATGAGTLPWGR